MKQCITVKRKGKIVCKNDFSHDANITNLVKAYEETGCDVIVSLEDRPNFSNFDDYAKLFPNGEHWRNWVIGNGNKPYKHYSLVPVTHSCLPGDYACVHTSEWQGKTFVHINDGDDFMFRKEVKDDQEAMAEIDNLKLLSPFSYGELKLFGYID